MLRTAFYISNESTRLREFLLQANSKQLDSIVFIFADKTLSSNYKAFLHDFGLEIHEFDYCLFPGATRKEKNLALSNKLLELLKKNSIDYCFSFGWHLLSGDLLTEYENRIINFHPAILPMFPGMNAIDQAVKHGNVLLVGNTAHFINSGVDTGPIIMQSVIPLESFYQNGRDYNVIMNLQTEMLNKLYRLLSENRIKIKENRVFIEGADYSKSTIYPFC